MALAHVATGVLAAAASAPAIPYPAGLAAGNLIIMVVTGKPDTLTLPTVSGFTKKLDVSVGSGTAAGGTGPQRLGVYTKIATGSESGTVTVTATGSPNVLAGAMTAWSCAAGNTILTDINSGSDTTSGTGFSATKGGSDREKSGDVMVLGIAVSLTTPVLTGVTASATSATYGTLTNRVDTSDATGNDVRLAISDRPISSGTATAATVASATLSTATTGGVAFIRLHEAVNTAADTNSGTEEVSFVITRNTNALLMPTQVNYTNSTTPNTVKAKDSFLHAYASSYTFMQFNLPAEPTNRKLIDASLYIRTQPSAGASTDSVVFSITNPANASWSDSTLTWNTQPTVGSVLNNTDMIAPAAGTDFNIDFDISVFAPSQGDLSTVVINSVGADDAQFYSTRTGTSFKPRLTLTYALDYTAADTGTGTEGTSFSLTGSGPILGSQPDTGTGTEGTVFVKQRFYTTADTGTGSETTVENQSRVRADTGTGSETTAFAKSRFYTAADTGTGTEATRKTRGSFPADTGTGSETTPFTKLRVYSAADTGTGSETIRDTRGVFPADSGTGSETTVFVKQRFYTAADSGTGTESNIAAKQMIRSVADTGTGTDSGNYVKGRIYTGTDSGTGTESTATAKQMIRSNADTGTGTEGTGYSKSGSRSAGDNGTGTEGATFGFQRARSAADSGTGSESTRKTRSSFVGDSGAGTEGVSRARQISRTVGDTGTGTESQTKAFSRKAADSSTGSETTAIAKQLIRNNADTGDGHDITGFFIGRAATLSESGNGAENTSWAMQRVRANSDTGSGADSAAFIKIRSFSAADTSTGTENTIKVITKGGTRNDTGSGTETVSFAKSINRTIGDTGTGSETFLVAKALTRSVLENGVGLDQILFNLVRQRPAVDTNTGTETVDWSKGPLRITTAADDGQGHETFFYELDNQRPEQSEEPDHILLEDWYEERVERGDIFYPSEIYILEPCIVCGAPNCTCRRYDFTGTDELPVDTIVFDPAELDY